MTTGAGVQPLGGGLPDRPCDGGASTWTRASTVYGRLGSMGVWVSAPPAAGRDPPGATPPPKTGGIDATRPCTVVSIAGRVLVLVQSPRGAGAATDVARDAVIPRLLQAPGVRDARLAVGRPAAILISLDPKALARTSLASSDVAAALARTNVNAPRPAMDGSRRDDRASTDDDSVLTALHDLRIGESHGGARVGDVGVIERSTEEVRSDPPTHPTNAALVAIDIAQEGEAIAAVADMLRLLGSTLGGDDVHIVEDLHELDGPR